MTEQEIKPEAVQPEVKPEAVPVVRKENGGELFLKRNELYLQIYEKWKDQPLLKGVPKNHATLLSVILDNQRLFKESVNYNDAAVSIYKHSVDIVNRIYKNHPIFNMVSVQPMLGSVGQAFYLKFRYVAKNPDPNIDPNTLYSADANKLLETHDDSMPKDDLPEISLVIEYEDATAKTKKTKAYFSYEDYEKEDFVEKLAKELSDELFREVCTDLRNNVGTVSVKELDLFKGEKELAESIYINIMEVSSIIHRKTLRGGANWLVTGPNMAKRLAAMNGIHLDEDIKDIKFIGCLNNRWRLYVDPLFPDNQILMGHKGDSDINAGYIYMPYISLDETPVILDPESFLPRKGLLVRYSKKLLREGAKGYALIKYKEKEKAENTSYVI